MELDKNNDVGLEELFSLRSRVLELEAMEVELRHVMEALEESEMRFRSVFENVSSGILMTGPQGFILMANAPALSMLGLSEDDLGGSLAAKLPEAGKLLSRASIGGQNRLEINAADGRRRLIGFTNASVKIPEGKGLITVFQDVSQFQKAEDRRRRAEQLAYVGELAARLSHEIKNPMATIQTGLKVLARQGELKEEDSEMLGAIIKEVGDVTQMVSGLLDAARYDKFQPEMLNLVALLHDVCDLFFVSVADRPDKSFELIMPDDEITVALDKKAMGRAVGNLIHNALDAIGRGGSVVVECEQVSAEKVAALFPGFKGPVVCVRVRDDGPGVPPEIKQNVFKPFFTTKEAGTGLGLAVARDIVDSSGGVLRVQSVPGSGAAFEIYLPSGHRAPCWDWVVYHEWEIYYGEDRCQTCEIKASGVGYMCWTKKISADTFEGERLPERCMRCPVFLAGNLGYFYQPGD